MCRQLFDNFSTISPRTAHIFCRRTRSAPLCQFPFYSRPFCCLCLCVGGVWALFSHALALQLKECRIFTPAECIEVVERGTEEGALLMGGVGVTAQQSRWLVAFEAALMLALFVFCTLVFVICILCCPLSGLLFLVSTITGDTATSTSDKIFIFPIKKVGDALRMANSISQNFSPA